MDEILGGVVATHTWSLRFLSLQEAQLEEVGHLRSSAEPPPQRRLQRLILQRRHEDARIGVAPAGTLVVVQQHNRHLPGWMCPLSTKADINRI